MTPVPTLKSVSAPSPARTRSAPSLRVVAIGGGTGLSTLLRGLKRYVPATIASRRATDAPPPRPPPPPPPPHPPPPPPPPHPASPPRPHPRPTRHSPLNLLLYFNNLLDFNPHQPPQLLLIILIVMFP